MDQSFLIAANLVAVIFFTTVIYGSDVTELTSENFDDEVLNSDAIWLIRFYTSSCDHCEDFSSEWSDAATSLKGVVKVAAVNVETYEDLVNRFGIQTLPTIKSFGSEKTVHKIMRRGIEGLVTLDDSNFEDLVYNSEDHWLVYIYSPWCGHCKTMFPKFASAASELNGKCMLGYLDGDGHRVLAEKLGVSGFPTIEYFPPYSTGPSDAINYSRDRHASDFVEWCLAQL